MSSAYQTVDPVGLVMEVKEGLILKAGDSLMSSVPEGAERFEILILPISEIFLLAPMMPEGQSYSLLPSEPEDKLLTTVKVSFSSLNPLVEYSIFKSPMEPVLFHWTELAGVVPKVQISVIMGEMTQSLPRM